MYPDAPVTRQRNGDGPGRHGAEGDDSAIWRFLPGLSVWPRARRVQTPRSGPHRHGGAVSPYERMDHAVQRRWRCHGRATGPAAVRWPAAARSAAGQIEKPTCSASLPLLPAWRPGRGCPALMCRTSAVELCISGVAGSQAGAQPGMSHLSAPRYPRRGALITRPARLVPARCRSPRSAPSGRQLLRAWRRGCWQGWRVALAGVFCQVRTPEQARI